MFRIPNLLGSVRIYSSLLLSIVIHMFMAFWQINRDRVESKINGSDLGLMESSGKENTFPSAMREWFHFIIVCPFTEVFILPIL